ncbi:S1/P1 nuclease [Chryseolinea soli]|uniref:S1/P1 Nuclease n=1 Tax=Chryseolinea soli TaxID=2321403 RepID=A0A385SNQ1_9BACT|nr:S1/P1 nuclease [Chryseolinea soli]AYB31981.1 hypothetical protein D4L85_16040 [Chryseolinea soli]
MSYVIDKVLNMRKYYWGLVFFILSHNTEGYDKIGHRIIAQIASMNLHPKAKLRIENILGKNGLANVSNWADEIRSDHAFDYSARWHYLNVDGEYDSNDLDSVFENATNRNDNLLFAIDSLIKVLRKNRNDIQALKFLVHFIGDLHQPLHLGRSIDRGGNLIKVKWSKDSINLHSLWDTQMINFEQLSYTEYSHFLLESSNFKEVRSAKSNLKTSFKKSYVISRRIYNYNYKDLNQYIYYYGFSNDIAGLLITGGSLLSSVLNELYS